MNWECQCSQITFCQRFLQDFGEFQSLHVVKSLFQVCHSGAFVCLAALSEDRLLEHLASWF